MSRQSPPRNSSKAYSFSQMTTTWITTQTFRVWLRKLCQMGIVAQQKKICSHTKLFVSLPPCRAVIKTNCWVSSLPKWLYITPEVHERTLKLIRWRLITINGTFTTIHVVFLYLNETKTTKPKFNIAKRQRFLLRTLIKPVQYFKMTPHVVFLLFPT